MVKKKRLKQLSGKTNGDDTSVSTLGAEPESSNQTTNPGGSETKPSNVKADTKESDKSFGSNVLTKNQTAPSVATEEMEVSLDKFARRAVAAARKLDQLHPPDGKPPSTKKVPPAASKQKAQRKDAIRNKIEQKMNMKKRKIKDPRLIPRMKEYLDTRLNKNFVSIPLMADYLQQKYPEYGRKKKSMFVQYVDKAYSYMEKPYNHDPPPPCSDTDEDSNTEKELVEENGRYVWKNVSEHSRDEGDEKNDDKTAADDDNYNNNNNDDDNTSDDDDNENLVEYKDKNSINNALSNMYRNSPTHASSSNQEERKRKLPETTPSSSSNHKRVKSDGKIIYASPYVLERNLASTGLVGPRRSYSDKYFIDRKGDNASPKKPNSTNAGKESREVTIQKFLGNLPSRTSFSSYVSGTKDPRLKGGTLYRVFTGKTEEEQEYLHSGITEENVGTTNTAPQSPSTVGPDDTDGTGEIELITGRNEDSRKSGLSVEKYVPTSNDKSFKTRKKQTSRVKKAGSSSRNPDNGEDSDIMKGPELQKSTVTFADVGGNESTLTEICKLLVHMRHPEVYCQLGVTPPRGFLLHGPPGCGKSLLANAIAGELDLPMMKLAATEIVSGVSGDSEEKIRGLFDKASQNAPCIVFIDEIDSITPKRETASKDMERRIVAQLLACMDDLNSNVGCHVLVIGATNRPDSIDPALRRAGRFDREISLGIPDEKSRLRILEVLCRNMRLTPDFDFSYIAHNTPGYVGADLMALTREAAMSAVNRVFQSLQSKPVEERDGKSLNINSPGDVNISESNLQSVNQPLTQSSQLSSNSTTFPVSKSLTSTSQCVSDTRPCNGLDTTMKVTTSQNIHSKSDNVKVAPHKETNNVDVKLNGGDSASLSDEITRNDSCKNSVETNQVSNTADINGLNNNDDLPKEISEYTTELSYVETNCGNNLVAMETSDNLNKYLVAKETSGDKSNNGVAMETSADNSNKSSVAMDVCSDNLTNNKHDDNIKTNGLSANNISTELCNIESKDKVSDDTVCNVNVSQSVEEVTLYSEYNSVLKWLKDHPPLTEEQLKDLYITMEDFKEALLTVQPSAKREGFATVPDVTWDDIGALQNVREELQLAILAPVRHPEQFKSLGLNRAQGILLAGPPGCGKTLLAKAVANESGINFISVKGPELLNMYVGESEKAVRTVFQRARNSSPCVIFFDELDALCPRRSGSTEGHSSARVVNQLLTEMDGLEDRKQVFIMAATNRPDIIDPAVLRPGRLDKTLYVGLPTSSDRYDILLCLTKNGTKPVLASDVKLSLIAEDKRANCFTGADLAALVREASIAALKEVINLSTSSNKTIVVTSDHFKMAFNKVKPSVSVKDMEKYSTMRKRLENE